MDSDARFERIERTMEFLAQGQARFDANQARFDANQARFDANQARFEECQVRFEARMDRISAELETVIRVQQGQQKLVEIVIAAQRTTDEKMRELVEKGKNTEDNVNALLKVVDGIIRDRPQ